MPAIPVLVALDGENDAIMQVACHRVPRHHSLPHLKWPWQLCRYLHAHAHLMEQPAMHGLRGKLENAQGQHVPLPQQLPWRAGSAQ